MLKKGQTVPIIDAIMRKRVYYIYLLSHKTNKYMYIGQTCDFNCRMRSHLSFLKWQSSGISNVPNKYKNKFDWNVTILEVINLKDQDSIINTSDILKVEAYHIRRMYKKHGPKVVLNRDYTANHLINKDKARKLIDRSI